MKRSQVTIHWKGGLHLRPAAKVVKLARSFHSSVMLKVRERVADARSILAMLMLCGTFGTVVDLEVSGSDEDQALAAIRSIFETDDPDASE